MTNRPRGDYPGQGGRPNSGPPPHRNQGAADRPTAARAPVEDAALKRIITDPNAAEELVKVAEDLGRELARSLTASQIRSLFSEVRQIEADWQIKPERAQRRLILLKPKMAYRARKESGAGVQRLVDVLAPAVDTVQGNADNFRRFVEFFEAILAYHKAHGGN